jgi:hypothetical protein
MLKRDHQFKRNKSRDYPHRCFCPSSTVMGGQDLATCQPYLTHPFVPAQHASETLKAMPRSLQSWASYPRAYVLGQCGHLMPKKTRRNRWLPRVPGSRLSRTANCPVTAWKCGSTTPRMDINIMMALTQCKLARWGCGSPHGIQSTKDPDCNTLEFTMTPGCC